MDNKNILKAIAATMVTAAFLAACAEKVEVSGSDSAEGIGIGVSVRQHWNDTPTTRATRTTSGTTFEVATAQQTVGGEPVYMWCDEIKGIDGKGLSVKVPAAADNEATRGKLMSGYKNGEFDKETFYDEFLIVGEPSLPHRTATWVNGNNWKLNSSFNWPDNEKIEFDFWGIAPANPSGMTINHDEAFIESTFTYVTPRNARTQSDLMVGLADDISESDREMWFNFEHVLTAVKFKIGDFKAGYKVTKIELAHIYKTATFNFEHMTWENFSNDKFGESEDATAYSENFGDDGTGVSTSVANKMITSDSEGTTFILLPQTLTTEALAIITLVDESDNSARYLSAQLSPAGGYEWKQGYTYTYTISSDDYPGDYRLTPDNSPVFEYDGTYASGDDIFRVRSYKIERNGSGEEVSQTAKDWKIVGYKVSDSEGNFPDEWETNPSMLKTISCEFDTNQEGATTSEEAKTVSLTVNHSKMKNMLRRDKSLQGNTPKEAFDLSLYKVNNRTRWPGGRTTANCYIVQSGGTYKFPLVMGNTIVKGLLNTPEDYGIADDDKVKSMTVIRASSTDIATFRYRYGKKTFVDYNGNQISRSNYKVKDVATVEILWHDFQDLNTGEPLEDVITDLGTTTVGADGLVDGFVTFAVDEEKIQQGNAVIVVKNAAGTIMWSWHIYITDRDWVDDLVELTNRNPSSASDQNKSKNYVIPQYNLGYVEKESAGTKIYPERKMLIKILQPESGLTTEVTVRQKEGTKSYSQFGGWDTKYQWGRKDAMPGTVEKGTGDNDYSSGGIYSPTSGYLKNGANYKWVKAEGFTYAESIQNPNLRMVANVSRSSNPSGKEDAAGYNVYEGCWSNAIYVNAWSGRNTDLKTAEGSTARNVYDDTDVVKTVYDPCPPGFCVPPSAAFTGFTKTGLTASGDNRRIVGTFSEGYTFYTNSFDNTSPTVFFPAAGRNKDSGLGDFSKWGYYWSATPGVPGGTEGNYWLFCGYHLTIKGDEVRPMIANISTMPQSVRPIAEKIMLDRINHNNSDIRPYDNNVGVEQINLE